VSHAKLRKETDCLNCGAELQGRFCHICGQQNLETNETFLGLVTHFVYDITHFDGKFFSTLKFLLLKPGFLSLEFQRGRRASYLDPIKMYVFTSAVFFFIFFSLDRENELIKWDDKTVPAYRQSLIARMASATDSMQRRILADSVRTTDTAIVFLEDMQVIEKDPTLPDSVRQGILKSMQQNEFKSQLFGWNGLPNNVAAYDSIQASLPKQQQDGWLRQFAAHKLIQLNAKFMYNKKAVIESVSDKFLHSLPKMMFVSLPFIALFISLLYIRQRRTHYVHHGILVIHLYVAMYILILLYLLLPYLASLVHAMAVGAFLMFLVFVYMLYYNYKSLRVFFGQSRGKTLFKFFILLILTFLLFGILSTIFVINSLLQA